MPKGHAERYVIRQNYRGKRGWSVVGATGVVHGTHPTRAAAVQQQAAIYASQAGSKKSMDTSSQDRKKKEMKKSLSVMENVPGCDGYAVVDDSGELMACVANRADAENIVMQYEQQDNMEDGADMMDNSMGKSYDTKQRREMARRGDAMPDGSFPIADRGDLQNAIQSVGRAANYESAKRHIMRRAKELGAEGMLPKEWMANKSLDGIFKSMPSQGKRTNSIGNKPVSFDIFKKGL